MRSLRSKLASTDICDICSHHEQEYLHKYSVVQRKCGNVFDQHKDCKPRQKSLREITRDKLCSLCRTHLQKLSVQAPEEFPTLDLPIPGPPTSYLNEELPLSASTESTSNDSVVYGVDIEEVIHYLNLTPVKLGKIDTSDVTKGSYIACMYDDEDDTCWICDSYILCTIEHPILTSRKGGYSISQESMSKATKAHNLWEK
eukprot:Em0005g1265a